MPYSVKSTFRQKITRYFPLRRARVLFVVSLPVTVLLLSPIGHWLSDFSLFSLALTDSRSCFKRIVRYHPSALEQSWLEEIGHLQSDDTSWAEGCNRVKADLVHFHKVLSGLQRHANSQMDLMNFNLSMHEVMDECTGTTQYIYLEPLISFLRHPLAICINKEDDQGILDKSYLLVPHAEELHLSDSSLTWLFDAGASVYDAGAGGASQKWFIETYRSRGIEFDRIICWEAAQTDPRRQWDFVPPDIKRKMSWYNIPLNASIGHDDNPFTFIKALTKPEDYVVFKLDIDAPAIEVAILRQLMGDAALLALIDEFYFEHHVAGSPMQWHGWGDMHGSHIPLGTMNDSYTIFTFLREKGVRAHAWV